MDIEKLKNNVINGYSCPFEALIKLKEYQDLIDLALNEIKPIALNHFENKTNGNEKTAKLNGYEFTKTQSGRYSYEHFDGYFIKSKELKTIEDKMKIALKMGQSYIDEETGECYPQAIYTPSKSSISLKKIK